MTEPMAGIPPAVACPQCGGYVRGHRWIGADTCSITNMVEVEIMDQTCDHPEMCSQSAACSVGETRDQLVHEGIRRAVQTCIAVPDQWQGTLHTGKFFYFRYRFGRASLAVGPAPSSVEGVTTEQQGHMMGSAVAVLKHGGDLDGCFSSDRERSEVFRRLYDQITGGGERPTYDDLAGYGRNGPIPAE